MVEFVCFIIAMISFLAIIMHSDFQIAVFNVKSKSQLTTRKKYKKNIEVMLALHHLNSLREATWPHPARP
jgi:hypothetical protein